MGWVCVTGLVYNFVAHPLLLWLVAAGGLTETSSPLLHDTLKDWSAYPNFSKSEFDCRHCGANAMQPGFMTQLQALRERFGKPMRITSGYRCTAHPIEAKKTSPGPHTTGLACDVGVEGAEAHLLLGLALELGFKGIGVQQKGEGRFLHLYLASDHGRLWSY